MFGLSNRQAQKAASEEDFLKLLGYKNCENDGILTRVNDTVSRFVRVQSTDLFSLDAESLSKWISGFTLLERTFLKPHKLITVTTRVDTSQQQQYWQRLSQDVGMSDQERTRLRLINENYRRLQNIERNSADYMDKYYLFQLFAENKSLIRQQTRSLFIATGNAFQLETLTRDETEEVLKRIFNMNSR